MTLLDLTLPVVTTIPAAIAEGVKKRKPKLYVRKPSGKPRKVRTGNRMNGTDRTPMRVRARTNQTNTHSLSS
jgi:hypothetical protein